ncbi:MAG: hypothetical protein ONB05_02125, partial [candidate division KSB1 bacterium]|nr:hypothetical protein [candidate division KSB1 bacterium]
MFTKKSKSLAIGGLLLSLVLISPDLSPAETLSHIPGAFLDVGLGAGPMGLGGSVIVLGRDVYTIVGNPAGLISLSGPEAAFSMTRQFSFVPYNLVLYGQNLGKQTAVGVGFLTSGDEALR